jgi:hypothetical protein
VLRETKRDYSADSTRPCHGCCSWGREEIVPASPREESGGGHDVWVVLVLFAYREPSQPRARSLFKLKGRERCRAGGRTIR